MKLLYEKDNKQQFLILLKFYWAFSVRFLVVGMCFIKIINIIFEKPIFHMTKDVISKICVFFILIQVLKLTSLLRYQTFKVIWTTPVPKSIFSKSFYYPAIAWLVLSEIAAILLEHHNLFPLFTKEICIVFLLHIFILNNWLPFQLIPLNPQDEPEKSE